MHTVEIYYVISYVDLRVLKIDDRYYPFEIPLCGPTDNQLATKVLKYPERFKPLEGPEKQTVLELIGDSKPSKILNIQIKEPESMTAPADFKDYDVVVGEARVVAINKYVWVLPGGEKTLSRHYAEKMAGRMDRFIKRSKQRI